jgi:hypothetical protein
MIEEGWWFTKQENLSNKMSYSDEFINDKEVIIYIDTRSFLFLYGFCLEDFLSSFFSFGTYCQHIALKGMLVNILTIEKKIEDRRNETDESKT